VPAPPRSAWALAALLAATGAAGGWWIAAREPAPPPGPALDVAAARMAMESARQTAALRARLAAALSAAELAPSARQAVLESDAAVTAGAPAWLAERLRQGYLRALVEMWDRPPGEGSPGERRSSTELREAFLLAAPPGEAADRRARLLHFERRLEAALAGAAAEDREHLRRRALAAFAGAVAAAGAPEAGGAGARR
jgi:hypothetical protein